MMKQEKRIKDKVLKGRDRVGFILDLFYVLVFLLSIVIFVRIVHIQLAYKVDPSVERLFRPAMTKRPETPVRGSILAADGRIIAISTPLYQVYMDCAVQKGVFAQDEKKGKEKEEKWRSEARELSAGLSDIYRDRTAAEYYDLIISSREKNKRYVRIGGKIDHETLQRVKQLPLFNRTRNVSGLIVEQYDSRQYPYGSLARRTIGYVKDNQTSGKTHIGIEGRYDYVRHGKGGYEWLRKTEMSRKVHSYDSTSVKAVDGDDVRTTVDIDIQDLADRALRNQITDENRVSGACAIIMEVETGAIRAMVNLQRDSTEGSPLQERFNLAISQVGEPGSVFKTVTLTSLLEDGYVKSLEETIPTNHGVVPGGYRQDVHILDYERETGKREITVKHGFEISSNYVFAYLATKYYGEHPENFFDKLYTYKLGEKFDFDIDGLGTPQVTGPKSPSWSSTTLGTTAYGYSAAVSPLQLVTFYNAIANRGKMMKPYLVEDIERNGRVLKKHGPSILGSVCSPATADTLTRALRAVTEEGTATRLRNAKLPVAGKTGTAQVALQASEHPRPHDGYHDIRGRKKNQGTFVGFFPADNPKYSILVTVYSRLSLASFYGGTLPAMTVKEIVDGLYAIRDDWAPQVGRSAMMPRMEVRDASSEDGTVPDVSGFGLIDAIYAIENGGFRCNYEGSGHVKSQSPAAGTKAKKGETIKLVLK